MQEHPGDREQIVVIDDDYAMRLSCRQILTKSGFEVETYEDGSAGLAGVAERRPALVVVDLKMPGLSGLDVIRRVREIDPLIVLIVITGYATVGTAVEAMQSGAYDFLPKPFKPDELRLIVKRALERRRLLQRSRELEMERELMKRRFVSFVSHQLKSPLAAVHQYLEVLSRLADTPDVVEKRQEWLARSLSRTREMRELIDSWLTLARAEGSGLVAERRRVSLAPILREVVETARDSAESAELALELELPDPDERGLEVLGDRNGLMVLFENLLTNALKYTEPGGSVTVRARSEGGEAVVEVEDTGVGIPESARSLLFEEFYRVGGSNGVPGEEAGAAGGSADEPAADHAVAGGRSSGGRRRPEGTGLGLAISKRIVAELGGAIEVESEVGVGSTFRVRLPALKPAVAGV